MPPDKSASRARVHAPPNQEREVKNPFSTREGDLSDAPRARKADLSNAARARSRGEIVGRLYQPALEVTPEEEGERWTKPMDCRAGYGRTMLRRSWPMLCTG